MVGGSTVLTKERRHAIYRESWASFVERMAQTFDQFIEAGAMGMTLKNALLAVLLLGARRREDDIRSGRYYGDLTAAESLVKDMQEALAFDMPRDRVAAARLLIEAANMLLEEAAE